MACKSHDRGLQQRPKRGSARSATDRASAESSPSRGPALNHRHRAACHRSAPSFSSSRAASLRARGRLTHPLALPLQAHVTAKALASTTTFVHFLGSATGRGHDHGLQKRPKRGSARDQSAFRPSLQRLCIFSDRRQAEAMTMACKSGPSEGVQDRRLA